MKPNPLCKKEKKGLRKGSITNTAHNPNTTDGIAASNSIIKPRKFLIFSGKKSSVINIAVPTPRGTAIRRDKTDVTTVPYIAVKAPYRLLIGSQSDVIKKFKP